YEGIPERAGREARRILDDVDVAAGSGARTDGAIRHDRSITLFAEPKAGTAPRDGAHVRDEWNGAGRWLQRNLRRLSGRCRRDGNRDEILVQRERGNPRGI